MGKACMCFHLVKSARRGCGLRGSVRAHFAGTSSTDAVSILAELNIWFATLVALPRALGREIRLVQSAGQMLARRTQPVHAL